MHKRSPFLPALLLTAVVISTLAPAFARDDIMPAPSRAPRTGVASEKLSGVEMPSTMMGTAQAIDGQTIRLHDSARDVTARLLGLVAPPLTTPDGVAARTALDGLLRNQTLDCSRRDRDRDGSLVMSCNFGGGRDLSEAVLFTGTALFSRNSAVDNDLAVRYRAAEETAQMRRLGLWKQVPAASATSVAVAATPEVKPEAKTDTRTANANNTPVISLTGPTAARDNAPAVTATSTTPNDSGFAFATWLEAIGLLGTLFGMLLWIDHRHTSRARLEHALNIHSDRQVLAAALTGELAAARDICEARAALVASGGEPRWPRLRTYIYQAHAEQIGLLGAVLARQVASIYGQMADYGASNRGTAYGHESTDLTTPASVSRALVRLCGYIEITLEGLAEVEHTGQPYYPSDDLSDGAEDRHASQIAQRTDQRTPQPASQPSASLPQTKAAPVQQPAKVTVRRIGRFDLTDNETPEAEAAKPEAVTPAPDVVKTAVTTPKKAKAAPQPAAEAAPEVVTATVATAAPQATTTAKKAATTAPAATRAARRAALQKKARAGNLFKAEQTALDSLTSLNNDMGAEDMTSGETSKTA